MSRILFFTTAIEHTTFRKTAKMLQEEGAKVHIIGFTRNNFPQGTDDISIESLGVLSHGNYISRIFRLFKFLFILRKRARDYDVIYNFTLDTLIISKIALLFCDKKWIYQIQDIRSIYFGNSLKSKIARFLEGFFIKRIDLLVVSSYNYYSEHYKKIYNIDSDKVIVIENKLVIGSVFPKPIDNKSDRDNIITIGYFGVMRCKRSWEILKMLAEKHIDRIQLYLRGKPVAMPLIQQEIIDISNINYGGLYKSPDDLNELYNSVDIVWACYPYSRNRKEGNWKLARTIRFYEALAFGKPVIVQQGTPQAEDVINYNIGLVVDMGNIPQTLKQLESIKESDLKIWEDNIDKLNPSLYYYTNEYKELLNQIENLKNKTNNE